VSDLNIISRQVESLDKVALPDVISSRNQPIGSFKAREAPDCERRRAGFMANSGLDRTASRCCEASAAEDMEIVVPGS
jgi:hypothetical protein